MTVGVETLPTSYIGDGVTTSFPLGFTYSNASDVVVSLASTPLTGGYAVVGGNVVFDVAPATGAAIEFDRQTPVTQDANFPANGTFPSTAFANQLDKNVRIAQEHKQELGDIYARGLLVQKGLTPLPVGDLSAGEGQALGIINGILVPVPHAGADAERAALDAEAARDASRTAQGLAEAARDASITAKGQSEAARDAAAVQAALAATNGAAQVALATVQATAAAISAAAAAAAASATGFLYTPTTTGAAPPYKVSGIAITAPGTATSNGHFSGVVSGLTGFAWSYQATVGGGISAPQVDKPALSVTNSAPTLTASAGGVSGATISATMSQLQNGDTFWAVSADYRQLLQWQVTGGVVVAYPDGNGVQYATPLATSFGTLLDPVEYEASGYVWAIVDTDFRIFASALLSAAAPQPVIATGLNWASQTISSLDPDEYEACGYYDVIVDAGFRIFRGTLRSVVAVAATVSADTLYDLTEIVDGSGKTQTASVSRKNGRVTVLSPAGSNNLPRAVRSDGYGVYKSDRASGAPGGLYARDLPGAYPEIQVQPSRAILALGDSLTYFGRRDGTAYWAVLGSLLGWSSYGWGISGQTPGAIAARWGAAPIYVTLTNNTLLASTPVVLTGISDTVIDGAVHYVIHGRVGPNGPYARMYRNGNEGASTPHVLVQDPGGVDTPIPPGTQFIPDGACYGPTTGGSDGTIIPYAKNQIFIPRLGRNSYTDPVNTIRMINATLATLTPLTKQFIVPLIIPGGAFAGNGNVAETFGTAARTTLEATNAALKAAYPDNWVDFMPTFWANGNGSTQDNSDIASGLIPTSLRQDWLHPNAAGRALEAQVLQAFIASKGWTL